MDVRSGVRRVRYVFVFVFVFSRGACAVSCGTLVIRLYLRFGYVASSNESALRVVSKFVRCGSLRGVSCW